MDGVDLDVLEGPEPSAADHGADPGVDLVPLAGRVGEGAVGLHVVALLVASAAAHEAAAAAVGAAPDLTGGDKDATRYVGYNLYTQYDKGLELHVL